MFRTNRNPEVCFSSSPQPPPTLSNLMTDQHNNNLGNDNDHDSVDSFTANLNKSSSPLRTSFADNVAKMSPAKKTPTLGSPCDERVPSRIPFSVQTNL
jgi:hypothetical protein